MEIKGKINKKGNKKGNIVDNKDDVVETKSDVVGKKSYIVDKKGNAVDQKGRVVAKKGDVVDQKGKVVAKKGDVVDQKGYGFGQGWNSIFNYGLWRKPVYTPPKKIKLTVILLENTFEVEKERKVILKIISNAIKGGKYIIVNYGEHISINDMEDDKSFSESKIFTEKIGDDACLLDVISLLEKIITMANKYETKYNLLSSVIDNIDVIGIGRCFETKGCSKVNEVDAMRIFRKVLDQVNTKYFCIDDTCFVNAALRGFRSIGAIRRDF